MRHRKTGATEAQIDYCACSDPDGCREYGCPFQDDGAPPNGWAASVVVVFVMALLGVCIMYASLQLFDLLKNLVR